MRLGNANPAVCETGRLLLPSREFVGVAVVVPAICRLVMKIRPGPAAFLVELGSLDLGQARNHLAVNCSIPSKVHPLPPAGLEATTASIGRGLSCHCG